MELVVFVLASLMAVVGAVGVVVRRNPVHAAMSLVLTLFGIAVIFVQQGAHFLAAVQVIVYAGAIVVLFLFVIMLLGVDQAEDLTIEPLTLQRPLAAVIGVAMVGLLTGAVLTSDNAVLKSGAGLSSGAAPSPGSALSSAIGSPSIGSSSAAAARPAPQPNVRGAATEPMSTAARIATARREVC